MSKPFTISYIELRWLSLNADQLILSAYLSDFKNIMGEVLLLSASFCKTPNNPTLVVKSSFFLRQGGSKSSVLLHEHHKLNPRLQLFPPVLFHFEVSPSCVLFRFFRFLLFTCPFRPNSTCVTLLV